MLGSGGQGSVYLATRGELHGDEILGAADQRSVQLPKQKYAIKIYEKHLSQDAKSEIGVLEMLKDEPHFVKIYKACKGDGQVFVARNIPKNEYDTLAKYKKGYEVVKNRWVTCMEHCKHGDLFDLLQSGGAIQDDRLLRYLFL